MREKKSFQLVIFYGCLKIICTKHCCWFDVYFISPTGLRQSEATYKCLHCTLSFPRVWLVCTTSPMRPWELAVNRLPPTAPLNPRRFLGEPCNAPVHLRRRWRFFSSFYFIELFSPNDLWECFTLKIYHGCYVCSHGLFITSGKCVWSGQNMMISGV